MKDRTNQLLFWIDYLATSSVIDEMLESYLLNDIETQAQKLKKDLIEGPMPDGLYCDNCNDYAKYAEANQYDGSFVCYTCRNK